MLCFFTIYMDEKSWERFGEFNASPYISPYWDLMEKRTVSLVHELLSLTLWKKLSIVKLSHFKREFGLPEKLNVLLLEHMGIFYVSNKYHICTVLLREGYNGSELIHKDPLVVVKDKFGQLMQQGKQQAYLVNLEKKRKNGMGICKADSEKERQDS